MVAAEQVAAFLAAVAAVVVGGAAAPPMVLRRGGRVVVGRVMLRRVVVVRGAGRSVVGVVRVVLRVRARLVRLAPVRPPAPLLAAPAALVAPRRRQQRLDLLEGKQREG